MVLDVLGRSSWDVLDAEVGAQVFGELDLLNLDRVAFERAIALALVHAAAPEGVLVLVHAEGLEGVLVGRVARRHPLLHHDGDLVRRKRLLRLLAWQRVKCRRLVALAVVELLVHREASVPAVRVPVAV